MPVNNFNYNLSWSDFTSRSINPSGEKEAAQIHPEMSFSNFQIGRKGNAVIIKDVDINISLVAADCWVVEKQKSEDLLKHEQGHFDILAICARDLYKAILALTGKSTKDLQTNIDKVKNSLGHRATLIDKQYDDRTDHGIKSDVQTTWNTSIETVKQNSKGSMDDLPA